MKDIITNKAYFWETAKKKAIDRFDQRDAGTVLEKVDIQGRYRNNSRPETMIMNSCRPLYTRLVANKETVLTWQVTLLYENWYRLDMNSINLVW